MAKPMLLLVVLLSVAGAGLPIILGIAHGIVWARWILQDTPRTYIFMLGVAVLVGLLAGGPLLWFARAQLSWQMVLGATLWAALGGWYGGPLLLNLLNHTGDAVATPVELENRGITGKLVKVGIVGAPGQPPADDPTFTCGRLTWQEHYRGPTAATPGRLYRGRLGLLWLEL